jgi:hypothetical protein
MRKEATVLTYFVVQSFQKGKKGGVLADTPVEARSAEAAVRMAERLASVTLGVVAFSRSGDPVSGEFADAVILAHHGHVPELDGEAAALVA